MSLSGRSVLRQLMRSGSGRLGVAFLLGLVAISIYVAATYPLDFGSVRWNNPTAWADNPKAVPPAWTSIAGPRRAEHLVYEATRPHEILSQGGQTYMIYAFRVDYVADEPPTFSALSISDIEFHGRPPLITLKVLRPDGRTLQLYRHAPPGPQANEQVPYIRYVEAPFRLLLSSDMGVAAEVSRYYTESLGAAVTASEIRESGIELAIFGRPLTTPDVGPLKLELMKGTYEIRVEASAYDPRDTIGGIKFVLGGSVYGAMGTDSLGRDLAVGLLFGFPVALVIGFVTSTLTTAIGTVLGIVSGYRGGRTDTVIQRASDLLTNIPLLPILIFLTFILGQKLWLVIPILIIFGWPGLAITIRSMVLQIKEAQFVESALSVGASARRIMFRHIFPQTAPFVFSQMIFFTPGAILAEAGLSFLGLGDPSIPTWGQILEQGFATGGIYVGYWWWVVPPGILLVLTALTFAFLALAMEPIVNPLLRTLRRR